MITEPGFYSDISAEAYHADPCEMPSLSSGIARLIVNKSPAHARVAHPRLNPEREEDEDTKFDLGTIAHTMLLGKGRDMVIVDANDWRTKAAKEARDGALIAGQTPCLAKTYDRATAMVEACREQLAEAGFGHVYSDATQSEVVAIWQDHGGVWCRAMLDWHAPEQGELVVYDYKTTAYDAEPSGLPRKVVDFGYEVQAAFYERGLQILRPEYAGRVRWRWVFQETHPPYSITIAELAGDSRTIGAKMAAAAIGIWEECTRTNRWPRWNPGVHRIEYPEWAHSRWIGREEADPVLRLSAPVLLQAPAIDLEKRFVDVTMAG
jgi:hypothetical protein